MKYEKIKLPEREDAFNKKMDSLFSNINKGISTAFSGGSPSRAHSGLSELEALGYKSMKELLYYSNKSILTLESVVANDIKLVNDIIEEFCKEVGLSVTYDMNMDITALEAVNVALDLTKQYIIHQKLKTLEKDGSEFSLITAKHLHSLLDSKLKDYIFDYAYDKQKNHLVLIALTEYQWNDIERENYNSLGLAGFKLKTPHRIKYIMDS